MDPSGRRTLACLGLLVLSLVVLGLGGFIQLDDTSGSGSDRWNLPLGYLALVLAACAVPLALPTRAARRALGASLLGLAVVIAVLGWSVDGFRFVYGSHEGELNLLVVVVVLVGVALAAPIRFFVYGVVVLAATVASFLAGAARYATSNCDDPDWGAECDLAGLEGLLWAGVALVLGAAVIIALEVRRWRSQRAASASAEATR
ncbi:MULTISPECIES: hypothetical protein [unclassified Nocardioides]|uniref:hypothetical protein n=1 Tax=unclassified Nocardioides TaxID=2615069 RepID=UPI0009EFACD2|nr:MULTISPECIES: hypothetical protein [unclassified Nocardioides]GAW48279.1 hypothetical protein PD653B2_0592 [Nocardioides sp. PD653-B2]GAW52927.1 hypothetical protein PD653_0321 [Nocardioides sp. PD653]